MILVDARQTEGKAALTKNSTRGRGANVLGKNQMDGFASLVDETDVIVPRRSVLSAKTGCRLLRVSGLA